MFNYAYWDYIMLSPYIPYVCHVVIEISDRIAPHLLITNNRMQARLNSVPKITSNNIISDLQKILL